MTCYLFFILSNVFVGEMSTFVKQLLRSWKSELLLTIAHHHPFPLLYLIHNFLCQNHHILPSISITITHFYLQNQPDNPTLYDSFICIHHQSPLLFTHCFPYSPMNVNYSFGQELKKFNDLDRVQATKNQC